MSGLISNNRFSQSTIDSFKGVDKNQDGNITIQELKSLDKNKDSKLSDDELNKFGITNKEDIQKLNSDYKEHKTSPNKVVFSNHKLEINKLSQDQRSKYETIKSALAGTPKLEQLHELLRKYNDSTTIDRILDRSFEKLTRVKNPKNIEFSKNDSEATNFGLDDANKIFKTVKSQIKDIPNRHGKFNYKYWTGSAKITIKRALEVGVTPLNPAVDLSATLSKENYSRFELAKNGNISNLKLTDTIKSVDVIANYAKKIGVGNCLENACLSAVESSKYNGINSIEIFQMPDISGGHAFTVINRDQTSDSQKMSTWGKDAIVIDTWSGVVFKAKDYPSDIPNKKHPKFPKGNISYDVSYK